MSNTIYNASINRFLHQQDRIAEYMIFFNSALENNSIENKNVLEKIGQFHIEIVIVSLYSFFEEFLKSIIFTATVHNVDLAKNFFINRPKDLEKINKCKSLPEVGHYLQEKVNFGKKAKTLKKLFKHLFNFPLFPDDQTEKVIFDFNLVRTIITHDGGWPSEEQFKRIKTEGTISLSNEIKFGDKTHNFYKLNFLNGKFIKSIYLAVNSIVSNIKKNSGVQIEIK